MQNIFFRKPRTETETKTGKLLLKQNYNWKTKVWNYTAWYITDSQGIISKIFHRQRWLFFCRFLSISHYIYE